MKWPILPLSFALIACQQAEKDDARDKVDPPAPPTDMNGARLTNPEIAASAMDGIEGPYIPPELVARLHRYRQGQSARLPGDLAREQSGPAGRPAPMRGAGAGGAVPTRPPI